MLFTVPCLRFYNTQSWHALQICYIGAEYLANSYNGVVFCAKFGTVFVTNFSRGSQACFIGKFVTGIHRRAISCKKFLFSSFIFYFLHICFMKITFLANFLQNFNTYCRYGITKFSYMEVALLRNFLVLFPVIWFFLKDVFRVALYVKRSLCVCIKALIFST
jgi:hypothetical protein